MWVLLGIVTAPWRSILLYSTHWTYIPAAILFAAGLWIYKISAGEFSSVLLGGFPELRPNQHQQRLITSGIRSRVRHPIYLAHFCEMLAWSVGTGLAVCYALTAFAVVTGAVMIRLEDQELERRFGEEYKAYRKNVPSVLPRI